MHHGLTMMKLTIIKGYLYDKIEFGINYAFNIALYELINKLTSKRFVSKDYVEESFVSAEKTLESNLSESAVGWFKYIAEAFSSGQIIDENSPHIEEISEILRAEFFRYIVMDGLNAEIAEEEKESEYLKYASKLISTPPSKVSDLFDTSSFYLNPQNRINTIKSLFDNHKYYFRIVIRRRMDNLFEKIQSICNDDT